MKKNIKLLDFKLKKNLWADIFWAYKSKFHWTWLDFIEHREYIFWDSVKNIDWKASAKSDKLYVKKFEEQRNIKIHFILDLNDSFYFFKKKLEKLKELLYTLAISANKNGDLISFSYFENNKLVFNKHSLSLEALFKVIDKIDEKKVYWDLEKQIEYLNKIKLENNLVFILSDKDSLENTKQLKLLNLKNEVIFINIFDYFENNLEDIDWFVKFSKNSDLLEINLKNEKKIEEYKKLRKNKLKKFKFSLEKLGLDYLYIDSSLNTYKELLKFFSV